MWRNKQCLEKQTHNSQESHRVVFKDTNILCEAELRETMIPVMITGMTHKRIVVISFCREGAGETTIRNTLRVKAVDGVMGLLVFQRSWHVCIRKKDRFTKTILGPLQNGIITIY